MVASVLTIYADILDAQLSPPPPPFLSLSLALSRALSYPRSPTRSLTRSLVLIRNPSALHH